MREGENVRLLCSATGVGINNFIYQWILNNLPIADQDSSILIITDVSEYDTGDYVCFVRNPYGGIGQSNVARLISGTHY